MMSHTAPCTATAIVPFTPPRSATPEPEAVLRFGDIEIRIGLTYLHHLRNCQGWGDRRTTSPEFFAGDRIMDDAMEQIERAMWAAIDKAGGR